MNRIWTIVILLVVLLFPARAYAIHSELENIKNQLEILVEQLKILKTASADEPKDAFSLSNIPEQLKVVALCESGDKHFINGKIVRGSMGEVGRFQIMPRFHQKTAESLGLDIWNEIDNAKFAVWLWEREGLKPWLPSKFCWSKKLAASGVK